ncbi:MAG: hypothetical protein E6I64_07665 [Chloroflexi bacterium]|nr:MAG: hypothetical protein E6I64_07665 [Chloroflexota bacterium]
MPLDALAVGNDAIADVLDEIGDLIELKGENVFRAVTYRAAARSIRDLREPLTKRFARSAPRRTRAAITLHPIARTVKRSRS